jgi:iron complex outermembrane recepter protein
MKNTRFMLRDGMPVARAERELEAAPSVDLSISTCRCRTLLGSAVAALVVGLTTSLAETRLVEATPVSAVSAEELDLTHLSIEQLMNIRVSILGPSEPVSEIAGAVSVVTQNDIKRSGAVNLPEALRLVPGIHVGQLDANHWAVSIRGFNDVFANKLLVLQDGRSIYTPLFSGVFWDVQGTLMEDIDRIEVVRGPGATFWGANAVNGVINVITKSAKDTQGALVYGGGGTQPSGMAGGRYGGKFGDNAYYRIYGTYTDYNNAEMRDGSDAHDSWQIVHSGFRTDWEASDQNLFTFQGDLHVGWINQLYGIFNPANPPTFRSAVRDDVEVAGGNLLGRWTHMFSDTSSMKLQSYYDRTERETVIFREVRDTFDIHFQHEFELGERNEVIWGAGYRVTKDEEENNPSISFHPERETLHLFSAFVQDEVTLVEDHLRLTLGTKFEHNDYTGVEIQPGARLLWTPRPKHSIWASVSRAVRTPSRAEHSINITESREIMPGFFVPVTLSGARSFDSEELIAYEIGYRTQPLKTLSFDVAAFLNDYDDLRSLNQSPASPVQFYAGNNLSGWTYGLEATATWRPVHWFELQPTYSLLQMDLEAHRDSTGHRDVASVHEIEGASPEQQFSIRSSIDLPHGVTLDAALRYVDRLPTYRVNDYLELNARIAWQATKNLELAIVGQNLLHDAHAEYGPSFVKSQNDRTAEIPRSVYGKVTLRF